MPALRASNFILRLNHGLTAVATKGRTFGAQEPDAAERESNSEEESAERRLDLAGKAFIERWPVVAYSASPLRRLISREAKGFLATTRGKNYLVWLA